MLISFFEHLGQGEEAGAWLPPPLFVGALVLVRFNIEAHNSGRSVNMFLNDLDVSL
jgi:hypothetical protein